MCRQFDNFVRDSFPTTCMDGFRALFYRRVCAQLCARKSGTVCSARTFIWEGRKIVTFFLKYEAQKISASGRDTGAPSPAGRGVWSQLRLGGFNVLTWLIEIVSPVAPAITG